MCRYETKLVFVTDTSGRIGKEGDVGKDVLYGFVF